MHHCALFYFQCIKIILGPSDAWSMRQSTQRIILKIVRFQMTGISLHVVFDSTNPNFARHKYFPGPGWCIMKMQKVQEFVCSNVFSYFERCEPVRSGSGLVERKINEK